MVQRKKVLVCGASGFIGRNTVERLAQRDDMEVTAAYLTRPLPEIPGVRQIRIDLRDAAQASEAVRGMDILIQAAATTSGSKDIVSRPHLHVTDNAVLNSLLFRAAHDHGVGHVLFFSCTIMYPSSDSALRETDFDANAAMNPRYFGGGWTKVYLEKMCEFYSGLGSTRFTAMRHSNIYGAHDKFDLERSHVFGATMTKVMQASDGRISVWGPGTERRDLLYVDDLMDFLEKAIDLQKSPYELVNVGCGQAVSVKELVTEIVACSGKELVIEHDLTKPHIPSSLFLDISKAKELFGWSPKTTLRDGILKTMEWYRANVTS